MKSGTVVVFGENVSKSTECLFNGMYLNCIFVINYIFILCEMRGHRAEKCKIKFL